MINGLKQKGQTLQESDVSRENDGTILAIASTGKHSKGEIDLNQEELYLWIRYHPAQYGQEQALQDEAVELQEIHWVIFQFLVMMESRRTLVLVVEAMAVETEKTGITLRLKEILLDG